MFFKSKIVAVLSVVIPAVTFAQPVDLLSGTPFTSEVIFISQEIAEEMTPEITEMPSEESVVSAEQVEDFPAPAISPTQAYASYYADKFQGRKTANGERFNMNALTAAHKKLAFGTLVKVTYQGKSVVVRINDRGPFIKGRDIDLSKAAAMRIGLIKRGHGQVTMEIL